MATQIKAPKIDARIAAIAANREYAKLSANDLDALLEAIGAESYDENWDGGEDDSPKITDIDLEVADLTDRVIAGPTNWEVNIDDGGYGAGETFAGMSFRAAQEQALDMAKNLYKGETEKIVCIELSHRLIDTKTISQRWMWPNLE